MRLELVRARHVMVRGLGLAALVASAMAAAAQTDLTKPEDVGLSSSRLALVRETLKTQIDAGQIPGAIVLVARDGKVVHFEAQGVAHPGTAMRLQTDQILGAGSLTKAVVAVAAMMLVEEGKIELDSPVSRYLPEFGGARQVRVLKPGSPPPPFSVGPPPATRKASDEPQYDLVSADKPMTVRMLLSHTSGIHIYGIANGFPQYAPTDTLATHVPRLALSPLEFQPGSRWAYSNNIGFELIGRVIEVTSGMDLKQFLHKRLFAPLGMNDTDMGVKRAAATRGVPYAPGLGVTIAEEVKYFNASAGLWTTAGDYSLFVRMLAGNGTFNGQQYLKPDTVKQMASNQIGALTMGGYPQLGLPPEGLKFGLGLMNVAAPDVAGTRLPAGSFGWSGDGTRLFWVVPEERLVILTMLPSVGLQAIPLQRTIESIVMSSIIRK